MPFWKNERVTPAQIIILGFLLLILSGAALLMLPISTVGPGGAPLIDALFTATSATCVTGLVLHDTATYWTPFGQLVIILLIQIGGMGVVTMAVAISMFAGKKIGLKQRWVMQESISAPQVGGIVRITGFILKLLLLIEGTGAVLLALRFCPEFGFLRGVWYAVFHSISAFCNAGFDLMGVRTPFSSLTDYVGDPLVNGVIMALIVSGGLGFLTWQDIWQHRWHWNAYRLQSKLVLYVTAALLLFSTLFFYLYEFALPQWNELTAGQRVLSAMFQSVSPRTAGFNTVSLGNLSEPGQFATILLMITGGSPGSTAGGFKTTTLAVLLLSIRAIFRRRGAGQCFGRRIPEEALHNAIAIFLLYIILFLAGGLLIGCIENLPLLQTLFEAASAIGTVGLTVGITPQLHLPSKLILIFLMYLGRVGGLTLLYAVASSGAAAPSQLPAEKVAIG